jgi:hypothetical protein
LATSLETPIKIRILQRRLYQRAKEESSYHFHLLYDKMYPEDVLGPCLRALRRAALILRDRRVQVGILQLRAAGLQPYKTSCPARASPQGSGQGRS